MCQFTPRRGGGVPTFPGLEGSTYCGRGVPILAGGEPTLAGGSTYLGRGVPTLPGGGGVPTFPGRNSITFACYVVGGMPLAFTQEDFLV